jgi:predicted ester cyclase
MGSFSLAETFPTRGARIMSGSTFLVRRWFEEVWNQRRGEVIDELTTAESVCFTEGGPIRGPAEFRAKQFEPLLAAFPDLHVAVEGTVEEGDQVVVRWTATGTHTGVGMGLQPSGRSVTFQGMSWIVVRDGRLHEGWQTSNIPEVLRSLTVPPA